MTPLSFSLSFPYLSSFSFYLSALAKVPPNKIGNTLWSKTGELEVPLDFRSLEDMFGAAVPTADPAKAKDAGKQREREGENRLEQKRKEEERREGSREKRKQA